MEQGVNGWGFGGCPHRRGFQKGGHCCVWKRCLSKQHLFSVNGLQCLISSSSQKNHRGSHRRRSSCSRILNFTHLSRIKKKKEEKRRKGTHFGRFRCCDHVVPSSLWMKGGRWLAETLLPLLSCGATYRTRWFYFPLIESTSINSHHHLWRGCSSHSFVVVVFLKLPIVELNYLICFGPLFWSFDFRTILRFVLGSSSLLPTFSVNKQVCMSLTTLFFASFYKILSLF